MDDGRAHVCEVVMAIFCFCKVMGIFCSDEGNAIFGGKERVIFLSDKGKEIPNEMMDCKSDVFSNDGGFCCVVVRRPFDFVFGFDCDGDSRHRGDGVFGGVCALFLLEHRRQQRLSLKLVS